MACPVQLAWNGLTPVAVAYDDIYFSTANGYEESCHVFLEGTHWPALLPETMGASDIEIVGELGFGSGLNFLATWSAWQQAPEHQRPKGWHYLSVEGHPLMPDQLRQVTSGFASWPEIMSFREALLDVYPTAEELRHGGVMTRRVTPDITLTWVIAPIEQALPMMAEHPVSGPAESGGGVARWYLDGFAPAKNPAMWAPEVLHQVGQLTRAGGRVATFTVARSVRDGLEAAGFSIARRSGFGHKRHCLVGVKL